MRLISRALRTCCWALHWLHWWLTRLGRVHLRLLVALRRRWILATLLRRRVLLIAPAVLGKRLAIRAVKLSVWRRILASPHGMRRDEGLSLRRHWSEDAFLGEPLAIGAAAVLRLVEARAADLEAHVSATRAESRIEAYLATTAIPACDCGPLTWRGLRMRVCAHRRLRIRWSVHLRGCRQRAVLVGVGGLQSLHHRWLLRNCLRHGRKLLLAVGVSHTCCKRGIELSAHRFESIVMRKDVGSMKFVEKQGAS